jgi:hypothetical protein
METPVRTMPLSRRIPKTILPRSIQSVPTDDTQTSAPPATPPPSSQPPALVNDSTPIPSSTIQWLAKDINTMINAGDPSLVVHGHANFINASASKLYIKADGVYCLQAYGTCCGVSIESTVMNGIAMSSPLQLKHGRDFCSVTCFLRKNDVISLSATPQSMSKVQYDPNQRGRVHTRQCVDTCSHSNSVCFSVSLI